MPFPSTSTVRYRLTAGYVVYTTMKQNKAHKEYAHKGIYKCL